MENRTVVWFSCGVASAIAAKLVSERRENVVIAYCNTLASESEDNARFMKDVEIWIGKSIQIISSKEYKNVDDVIEKRKYMTGIHGAPCTIELKKVPRFNFQQPDDEHVFGLTFDESGRIYDFSKNNHDLKLWWILKEEQITKADCLRKIQKAGIELPILYKQGYKNNNCIGCVKATSADYWNKIREDYPEVFARRVEQSRRLGAKLVIIKNKRAFLDELSPNHVTYVREYITCGPECGITNG